MDFGFKAIIQSDCDGWYRNMKKYACLSFEEVVKIVLFIHNINVIIILLA